ncbi:MAG: rRNA maturation RNase YbeY [Phycisphaerales bacterium]|nr:rRNA maturation RNase YbeY [Phycisphaerales bacterium]
MTETEDQTDQDPPSNGSRRRLSIVISDCPEGLEQAVCDAARLTLRSHNIRRGCLEVAVVGMAEMCRQHERWMGDASPTDVLTFDLRDKIEAGVVDGQLLVCKSVARRRARGRGADWRGELLLYVVHGCLHLCGYDDQDESEASRMHEREDQILSDLGWGEVYSKLTARRRKKTRNSIVRGFMA